MLVLCCRQGTSYAHAQGTTLSRGIGKRALERRCHRAARPSLLEEMLASQQTLSGWLTSAHLLEQKCCALLWPPRAACLQPEACLLGLCSCARMQELLKVTVTLLLPR